MNKRFDIFTFLLALLILSIIFLLLSFAITAMISSAADAEAQEIMEQAQERIDLYKAASTPAKERPATVVVYEASPAVETPEPPPEPVEDWYIESIQLDKQLQKVVFDAACENGVDYFTALGLIQVESNFQADAVNPVSGCRGLCQLSPVYFPGDYTPEENVRAGMEYLGQLIESYQGDVQAALRAYNRGWDDGARGYPYAVLSAAEDIMRQAGMVFP